MTTSTQKDVLRAHREQVSRLLCSPISNPAFGEGAWWEDTSLAEDEWFPEIEEVFGITIPETIPPSPAAATPSPAAATPSPAAATPSPVPSTPTPPPPPPPSPPSGIPPAVQDLATYIKGLPKKKDGLPSRNKLRKDARLRGEVSRKTGCLRVEKRGGKLRKWQGDERLLSKAQWDWLVDVKGDAEGERESVELAMRLQREERGLREKRRK